MMIRKPLKPWHGVLFFAVIMAAFFLICVPMQIFWGLYGVAATELVLLFLALGFARIMGYPLRILFPVSLPSFLPLLGTGILWVSSYLVTMVISLLQYRLFPEGMEEVSGSLDSVIFSTPFLVSVIIVAVLPAICEEAVHRGVILHTLYPIRKKWVVVLLMGIYFGIFHASLLRFLPTAILGAVMSYIMLETENMVYSSLYHGINNFLPLLLQQVLYGSDQMQQISQEMLEQGSTQIPLASLGIYMIFAAAAPFGLYLGNHLLHWKKGQQRPFIARGKEWKVILWIAIPTACFLILGGCLFLYGVIADPAFRQMIGR